MVQVTIPSEWLSSPDDGATGIVSAASHLNQNRQATAPHPAAASPSAERAAEHLGPAPAFEDAADAIGELQRTPELPSSAFAVAKAATPADATLHSTETWKFAVVVIGSALGGAGLVALALMLFSRQGPNQAASISTPPSMVENEPPRRSAGVTQSSETNQPAEPPADGEVAEAAEDDEQSPSTKVPPAGGKDRTVVTADEPDADQARIASLGPPPRPLAPGESLAEPENPSPPTEPSVNAPRLRIDPLKIDPEGLDLSTLFRDNTDRLTTESQIEQASQVSAEEDQAAARQPSIAAAASRPDEPAVVVDAAPGSVAELLARRVPAVNVEQMPLCEFIEFTTALSGLPVSVSSAALHRAGISPAAPVAIDEKMATIEEILATALKPLRLAPTVSGPHIVLRRVGSPDRIREIVYPIDDLAASDEEAEQWAQRLRRLVAPEAWSADGYMIAVESGPKLRIVQTEQAQYDILVVLERYRVLSGLQPRSKYPVSLLEGPPPYVALSDRLGRPAMFNFSRPTPLDEIVRYWRQDLGVAVLVDWPAVAEQRLWPRSRISGNAANKTWAEALDQMLDPSGLAWRGIGTAAIEITSLDRCATDPQLHLYKLPVGAKVSPEALLARIQELASAGSQSSDGAVIYDSNRRILLVRKPAPVHRAIAEWLMSSQLLREPAIRGN